MKISYRTHPILEKLETGKLGVLGYSEQDKELIVSRRYEIKESFARLSKNKFDTYYITKPFCAAFESSVRKLANSELLSDIISGNYCFISGNHAIALSVQHDQKLGLLDVHTIMINPANKLDSTLAMIGETSIFYDNAKDDDGRYRSAGFAGYASSTLQFHPVQLTIDHLLMILFIKYAQIETVLLPPNKKTNGTVCNYKNETKTGVTILDSKWFTTLVKSDSFKVRGHFRLQPKKKDGEWTKELIWISDFIKNGYTSEARKLHMA